MLFDVAFPHGTVKQNQRYNVKVGERVIPLISADVDSYLVAGHILSPLEFSPDLALHNVQIGRFSALAKDVLLWLTVIMIINQCFKDQSRGCRLQIFRQKFVARVKSLFKMIVGLAWAQQSTPESLSMTVRW